LQAVALNEGLLCKKKLWRERGRQQLEAIPLAPWASRRRRDLLESLNDLPGGYRYFASQWEGETTTAPIVLMECNGSNANLL